jgi:tetratricopeptide (TPR) repeat protein
VHWVSFLLNQFSFQEVILVIDKEKILGIAQKYILRGQSKKAIKEYLKLIEAKPQDKRLHLRLGDLYLKIGEDEKAIKEFIKVADLYAEEELNFRAISIYKKVLSIHPKEIEALRKTAQLYLKEGLAGSAKNYYQSILQLAPDDPETLRALEEIENYQQPKDVSKPDDASEFSVPKYRHPLRKKGLEERSDHAHPSENGLPALSSGEEKPGLDKDSEMHYHLGIAYKEMELLDYAISEFESASSRPSLNFDCYVMLGDCYMEKGEFEKSIDYYKRASETEGLSREKLARVYLNLGLAYEAKGMIPDALNILSQAFELDPSFSEAEEKIKKLKGE